MRRLSVVICVLLVGIFCRAQSQTLPQRETTTNWYRNPTLPSTDFFSVIYPEENLFRAAFFGRERGHLQQRIWRRSFSTQSHAEKYLQNYLQQKNYKLQNKIMSAPGQTVTEVAGTNLWDDTEKWSWDWEVKYGDWVRQNVASDFLKNLGIASDCADLAFSVRWIFARINHLPAANTMVGTGDLITNRTMKAEWMSLPTDPDWRKDKRFFAALDSVLDNTYTHSLFADSYPVAINVDTFLPGLHYLTLWDGSGHTEFVHRVNEPGQIPLMVLNSTVPKAVRDLAEGPFAMDPLPVAKMSGFLRMRWPEDVGGQLQLKKAETHPSYSLEQYDSAILNGESIFAVAVMKRLNPNFDMGQLIEETLQKLTTMVKDRVQIVDDGYQFCQSHNCAEGTSGYEDWSTPTRDARILDTAKLTNQLITGYYVSGSDEFYAQYLQWRKMMEEGIVQVLGQSFPIGKLLWAWEANLFNSDPLQTPATRWGLNPQANAKNLRDRLEQSLTARSTQIMAQGNRCQGSNECAVNGPEWLKWQTIDLDASLIDLYNIDRSYGQIFSADEYTQFHQALGSAPLQGKTSLEWLELAPWLNSDPNASLAVRWGANSANFPRLALPGAGKAILSTDRQWLFFRHSGATYGEIFDLSTHQKQKPSDLFQFVDLQAGTNLTASLQQTGNELQYEFKAADGNLLYQTKITKDPAAPLFEEWTECPGVFAIRNGTSLIVVDVNQKTLSTYRSRADLQSTFQKFYLVESQSASQIMILDFSGSTLQSLEFTLPNFDESRFKMLVNEVHIIDQHRAYINWQLCEIADLAGCEWKELKRGDWVDRDAKTVLNWKLEGSSENWTILKILADPGYVFIRSLDPKSSPLDYEFQLAQILSPGKLRNVTKLGRYANFSVPEMDYDSLFVYSVGPEWQHVNTNYFVYAGHGQLKKLNFDSSVRQIDDCVRDYCILRQGETQDFLARVSDGKEILRTENWLFLDRSNLKNPIMVYGFNENPSLTMSLYRFGSTPNDGNTPDVTGLYPDATSENGLGSTIEADTKLPVDTIITPFRNQYSNQGAYYAVKPNWKRYILSGTKYSTAQSFLLF